MEQYQQFPLNRNLLIKQILRSNYQKSEFNYSLIVIDRW